MKFFKYSLIAALTLSGVLTACDDDTDYAPGALVPGDEVYFPINADNTISIAENATFVDIAIERLYAVDDITVPVTAVVTDETGNNASDVFTTPSQVTFNKGQKTAELKVAVDFAKVVPDAEYTLTLKLSGDNTTPYGASSRTYTLSYAPWTQWEYVDGEIGTYTLNNAFYSGTYECDIIHRNSIVNPNNVQYGIAGLFTAGIDFVYSMDLTNTIDVDGVQCPLVSMNVFELGKENGAGSGKWVLYMDVRTWLMDFVGIGADRIDAVLANNNWGNSYYNPQTGTFCINLVATDVTIAAQGSYYSVAYEYAQLPGFKSYNVEFDYTGNYVDLYEDEYAIVNAYKSEDVASFVYGVFPGELSNAQFDAALAEVKEDDTLEPVTAMSTNLTIQLPEDGMYTIVAVGRDTEGNEVCKTAYSFKYATVRGGSSSSEWTSLGYAEYTDGIISGIYRVPSYTWDVEVQDNINTPGLIRLVDPYKEWVEAFRGVEYTAGKHYITIDATDPAKVVLIESNTGVDINNTAAEGIIVSSLAYDAMSQGYNPLDTWYGVYADGAITFPTGTLLFIDDDGAYYTNLDPNNNTKDETGTFNPYWGQGQFYLDMSAISSAPKNKLSPIVYNIQKKSAFKTNFKIAKKSNSKSVSDKTINDYRLSNMSKAQL